MLLRKTNKKGVKQTTGKSFKFSSKDEKYFLEFQSFVFHYEFRLIYLYSCKSNQQAFDKLANVYKGVVDKICENGK